MPVTPDQPTATYRSGRPGASDITASGSAMPGITALSVVGSMLRPNDGFLSRRRSAPFGSSEPNTELTGATQLSMSPFFRVDAG